MPAYFFNCTMLRAGMIFVSQIPMPRSKRQKNVSGSYHISVRANNKSYFQLEMSELWDVFSEYLYFLHHGFGVKIHNFVLMSNHFHLQASFPNDNISSAMCYFMTNTSKSINYLRNTSNHVYGARYYSSLILTNYHFANVYKYISQNPIRAGLSISTEDYPWCTINGIQGNRKILIPVTNHPLNLDEMIYLANEINFSWLNQRADKEHIDTISKALKRRVLKFPNQKGKANPLNSVLI